MRVLGVSINGVGVGHVTVMTGLLRAIQQYQPESAVLHATSSHAIAMSTSVGIPTVRLSSFEDLTTVVGGAPLQVHPVWQDLTVLDIYRRVNQAALRYAMNELQPDVLVVDGFPRGPLDSMEAIGGRARSVLLLGAFQQDDYLAELDEFEHGYDELVIPWPAQLREYWPGRKPHRARWVGPISYSLPQPVGRTQACEKLGLSRSERYALIALGGGLTAWGREFLDGAIAATLRLGLRPVVALPPLVHEELQGTFLTVPADVIVLFQRNLGEVLPAFDVALTPPGWNSLTEVTRSGVPVLWASKQGTSGPSYASDQDVLGQALASLGVGHLWHQGDSLEASLEEALSQRPNPDVRAAFMQNGNLSLTEILREYRGERP